jgi:hypothetical protein
MLRIRLEMRAARRFGFVYQRPPPREQYGAIKLAPMAASLAFTRSEQGADSAPLAYARPVASP